MRRNIYEVAKDSLKPPILDFKIAQGHRCWYFRKDC